jgi:glycosyltransferase involved in cell wall biosynthesis
MARPPISIITVCYNEEKNIKKTCESISNQKYKNFEWMIVDGKSTDKTLSIIKKYKKNITSLTSEKDTGVYNAMNKGIAKTKGEYLLFLNGGDYFKNKDTLQKAANFIQKDKKENEIYYGDLLYENGETVSYSKAKLDEKFFISKTISHQATFIKKDLFKKIGKYNEKYEVVADFDFWIKAIINGKAKVKYLPVVISVFDLSGMSTDYKVAKQHIKERIEVLLAYGLINQNQAVILKRKWLILGMLKRLRVYNFLRKNYRRVIQR